MSEQEQESPRRYEGVASWEEDKNGTLTRDR